MANCKMDYSDDSWWTKRLQELLSGSLIDEESEKEKRDTEILLLIRPTSERPLRHEYFVVMTSHSLNSLGEPPRLQAILSSTGLHSFEAQVYKEDFGPFFISAELFIKLLTIHSYAPFLSIEPQPFSVAFYSDMAVCYALLAFVALFAILPDSDQCATSGLCGYGPSCGPVYQPPPSCGCAQRGYSCGSYGCYRHRVRGAKSFQPHRSRARVSTSLETDRELLKERAVLERVRNHDSLDSEEQLLLVSRSVAQNRHRNGPIDPNRAFYECCLDRKLPDACLSKCNFNTYNKQSLTAMYFKQDPCPLAAMKEMQFCAAQGRDHRDCCARNGVTTTLAGPKCLTFCDQRLGQENRLDMSFVPCFDRFESMKSCFWHDLTRYYKA
ncbi:unnamed protein product [Auanema sp. JU1783]|nr:unnamed protein product [Auanema sp. JU1783]